MKKVSKTKVEKKLARKTNVLLRSLIIQTKKVNPQLANLIAAPRRRRAQVNIDTIAKESKENEVIVVPGKVLGKGDIHHSITIAALSFSHDAARKLRDAKCKLETIDGILHHKTIKIIK